MGPGALFYGQFFPSSGRFLHDRGRGGRGKIGSYKGKPEGNGTKNETKLLMTWEKGTWAPDQRSSMKHRDSQGCYQASERKKGKQRGGKRQKDQFRVNSASRFVAASPYKTRKVAVGEATQGGEEKADQRAAPWGKNVASSPNEQDILRGTGCREKAKTLRD